MTPGRHRSRAALVGGERSHHCANPAFHIGRVVSAFKASVAECTSEPDPEMDSAQIVSARIAGLSAIYKGCCCWLSVVFFFFFLQIFIFGSHTFHLKKLKIIQIDFRTGERKKI